MTARDTKSTIVPCPRCEELLLVETGADAASATVTCWNCEDRLTVPGAALTPDERVL